MGNYYTLGTQLPTLKQGDYHAHKLTSKDFVEVLTAQATKRDQELVQLILLSNDNKLLMQMLRGETPHLTDDKLTAIGEEKLRRLIALTKQSQEMGLRTAPELEELGYPTIKKGEYPKYLIDFVAFYLQNEREQKKQPYFYDDLLLIAYSRYIQQKGNKFLRYWYGIEQDIVATFATISAEKYGLDPQQYIIADKPLHQALIAKDWQSISASVEGKTAITMKQIAEEPILTVREEKIDNYKWGLLDEVTFSDVFSIDAMLAYLLKLQILERWEKLDKVHGEQQFRHIVESLNKDFRQEMDTFKQTMKHLALQKKRRQDDNDKQTIDIIIE